MFDIPSVLDLPLPTAFDAPPGSRRGPGRLGPQRGGRSAWERAMRGLALGLIIAGALALLDASITLLWQEPISALYATLRQDNLSGALRQVERAPLTPAERQRLASLYDERSRIAFLAQELEQRTPDGGAVGRIVIPRIGASFVVVKGTDTEDLRSGPGVYPQTSFPGAGRTTAIAGHRTTFLAPFRHIDELRAGSGIRLEMPYAEFTYVVIGQRVVDPSDVAAAVADVGYNRLVLSACTPLFSAAQRLLVFAHLVLTVPRGAARSLPGGMIAQPIEAQPQPSRPSGQPALPAVLEPVEPNGAAAAR